MSIHPVVELQAVQMESGRPRDAILDSPVVGTEVRQEAITGVVPPGPQDIGGRDGAGAIAVIVFDLQLDQVAVPARTGNLGCEVNLGDSSAQVNGTVDPARDSIRPGHG